MREIDELDPQQLAGQLLVVGFEGEHLPEAMAEALKSRALGGVILFKRNVVDVQQVWRLCTEVYAAANSEFPPFVSVDQEGGRVARLRSDVLAMPPMRTLGKADDLELSSQLASYQALQMRALGFNLNFAPVADVDSNPKNPVIGDRSFGADPKLVTRHCRAFIEAFQGQGVMACVKHFPGHGDTLEDSHLSLPRVSKSVVQLRTTELYPFERLVSSAAAVMTAHVIFDAFDAQPATFSARLCTSLLRTEFGFEGVLFSDDLEMRALSANWSIEQSARRAIEAGCDALLVCSDTKLQEQARQELANAIATDAAFARRCREAAERSLVMRRRYPPSPAHDDQQLKRALGAVPDALIRRLSG